MIAIGVGCRKGCPADDIVALVRDAMAMLPPGGSPASLVSIEAKRGEPGLEDAARRLGLTLVFFEKSVLQLFATNTKTYSQRIDDLHGVPSVAETAALAGAGRGAVLIVPRLASAGVTCAIAGSGRL